MSDCAPMNIYKFCEGVRGIFSVKVLVFVFIIYLKVHIKNVSDRIVPINEYFPRNLPIGIISNSF